MSEARDISKLTQRLLREARKAEEEARARDPYAYCDAMSIAVGTLMSHMQSLYDRLAEDDHMREFLPRSMQDAIDEIGQTAVMEKLKS